MTERLCQSLGAILEEKEKAVQSAKAEIAKERDARSENLENVRGKRRVDPERKEEMRKLERSFPLNRSKKLCPNDSCHHQMKVKMID